MKFIGNKWTRLVVFLTAIALVCVCTLSALNMVMKYNECIDNQPTNIYAYSDEANRLYTDLWAFSNIYLRNLEDGILSNSSYKTPYIKEAMKLAGFDVAYNHALMRASESIDYCVSNTGTSLYTNTDNFIDDEYTMTSVGNNGFNGKGFLYGVDTGCRYYTNGMGFEYYYLAYYNRGVAVYDYDTTGLESYTDELGAVIYLNEDGTSPIPTKMRDEEMQFTVAKDYVPFFEGDQSGCQIKMRLKSELLTELEEYDNKRNTLEQEITDMVAVLVAPAAVVLILTIYLIFTAGYDSKEKKYRLTGINRVYTEIHLIVCVFALFAVRLLVTTNLVSELKNIFSPDVYSISVRAVYLLGIGGAYTVMVLALSAIILRIRCRKLVDTTVVLIILRAVFRLVRRGVRKLGAYIDKNRITRQMIKDNEYLRRFLMRTLITILAAIGAVLLLLPFREPVPIIFALAVIAAGFVFLSAKDLKELSPLSAHIRKISQGDYSIYDGNDSIATYGMHTHLNNISSGMENAVEKQLRSERMKIDLVTNVSHDLKTPLTSIISYIDLLSKEELSPEARDYVTVLEAKAQKLKLMVSDVFDLAKATSGTDVLYERMDAVVLLEQILGDLSDKIEKSGMEIRKNINAEAAPVMADGRKLYRVMQNIIDNALKYSLNGTRIYITLDTDEDNAVIKVQNISSYEMSFSAEEITERFVRGDEARTSEGNGLGLSIAKSYTEACGGSFGVEINGDSFTAVVTLPLTE